MAFPTAKKVAETLRILAARGEMLPAPAELFDQPIDLNSDAPPSYDEREQWMGINKATGREMSRDRFKTTALCFFPGVGNGGRWRGGYAAARRPTSTNYLVAAGCFACRHYLMVEKAAKECPLCRGEITTFERKAAGGGGGGAPSC